MIEMFRGDSLVLNFKIKKGAIPKDTVLKYGLFDTSNTGENLPKEIAFEEETTFFQVVCNPESTENLPLSKDVLPNKLVFEMELNFPDGFVKTLQQEVQIKEEYIK